MQDQEAGPAPNFPTARRDWAGNQAGGVRRLFDDASGLPTGRVPKTHLLNRLEAWARSLAQAPEEAPRVVLLVGGPGNGKTEAIESTVDWLDKALGCNDTLREETAIRGDAAHTSIWRSIVIKTKDGATIEITLFSDTPAKLALNKESDK